MEMSMWGVIGTALTAVIGVVSYFVARNKSKNDTTSAAQDFAREKSRTNQAADDRQDIESQRNRISEEKAQEIKKQTETNL